MPCCRRIRNAPPIVIPANAGTQGSGLTPIRSHIRRFTQSTVASLNPISHNRLEAAFPWLLALLVVGYTAFHSSDPVSPAPDSGGYLNFSEHRTAGYPLFLGAVEALFGTMDAALKVRVVLAA